MWLYKEVDKMKKKKNELFYAYIFFKKNYVDVIVILVTLQSPSPY